MQLYTYCRSSSSYRVRIGLNLKGIAYESIYINLLKQEQRGESYKALNPQQLVPILKDGDKIIHQSLAILVYLDQTYPEPSLLPKDPYQQALIRAFSLDITSDLHPLNNLRVQKYLSDVIGVDDDQKNDWYQHWLNVGLTGLEVQIKNKAGDFCFGNTVSLADVCLIPQIYNAIRYKHSIEQYPTLMRVYNHCLSLPAFFKASPEQQKDFPS
ncbi:MAG: maleylacetoacetate isomerase [Alphaproteobacteria bacterium]|nr:maleylacetoacetate isomerase [Alphaproteobacteria bacterium]